MLGQHGDLLCAEAATGREVRRKSLTEDLGGKMMSDWGYSESPLVDGDHLVCTPGGPKGTMAALNRETGEVIWQSEELDDAAAYSSIVVAEIGVTTRSASCSSGPRRSSRRRSNGSSAKLLWRAEHGGETAIIPTPIVHDSHVFVSNGYKVGTILLKITAADGKFNAEEVYTNRRESASHGGIIRIGDYVYTDGWCMEWKTGKVVAGGWGGAITCADGHIYSLDQQGRVSLSEAAPTVKKAAQFDLPDRSE